MSDIKKLLKDFTAYIGPHVYKILFVTILENDDDGECDSTKREIKINNNKEKYNEDIRKTLFHELLHAHFRSFGHASLDTESKIEAITTFYHTLFDPKNRKIVEIMIECSKEKGKKND
jgi:hypothetical protein